MRSALELAMEEVRSAAEQFGLPMVVTETVVRPDGAVKLRFTAEHQFAAGEQGRLETEWHFGADQHTAPPSLGIRRVLDLRPKGNEEEEGGADE